MRRDRLNAMAWRSLPDVAEWVRHSRLNVAAAAAEQRDAPEIKAARATIATHSEAAMVNLSRMLEDDTAWRSSP